MRKVLMRAGASFVILVGIFLLGKVLYHGASGVLARQHFGLSPTAWPQYIYASALSLPVPLHIISVGLILQQRWLPSGWAKAARWAAVVSGCWLGVALAYRWLVL